MKNCYGILFLSICMFGCSEPDIVKREIVRPIKIVEVTADGRSGRAEYPGVVGVANEVSMSFGVDGKLSSLNVKASDRVKKGQVLAQIDAEKYKAQLALTLAKESAARADFQRYKQLFAVDAATKQELDFVQRNLKMAVAQTRVTRKNMDDTVLVAPFAGVISSCAVDNFQSVYAKQQILLLQDEDENGFEVKIDVPERDIAGAEKGLTLKQRSQQMTPKVVFSNAPDKEYPAYFKEAQTVADPEMRTYEVTLGFSPPEELAIGPGMTARVVVVWPPNKEKQSKMFIPAQAILPGPSKGQVKVWTIDTKTMTAKGTPVEVGRLTGNEIEVLKGLESGVSIAVSGVQQLRDGMKVSRYKIKNY
jgi:multidrug efflux system membrane fusion protein